MDLADSITLRTDRLALRPLPPAAAARLPHDREGAAQVIGATLDDEWPLPDILDLLPGQAQKTEAAARFGAWLVIEQATNTVVGDIGFIGPPDDAGAVEIGYSLVPSRRRRGLASEAATALVAWAFSQAEVRSINAETEPGNAASERVLEWVGFEQVAAPGTGTRWRLERAGASP